jgi:hypothetical protein
MRYDLNMPRQQKARIWIDEYPPCNLGQQIAVQRLLPAQHPSPIIRANFAIEWTAHVGPRTLYGLLGAQIVPTDVAQLKVVIHTGTPEAVYSDTIASRASEDVRIGLPNEYAAAVVAGIAAACAEPLNTRRGIISIEVGAHGLVGSSENIFQRMGRAFGELSKAEGMTSPEEIAELLKAAE